MPVRRLLKPAYDWCCQLKGAEHIDSFSRMLNNDAELQSLVLWNRYWSAALYGVADQVTKVKKLRNIYLENQAFKCLRLHPVLFTQVSAMSTYDRQHS